MTELDVTERPEPEVPAAAEPSAERRVGGPTVAGFTGWRQLLVLAGAFAVVIGLSALLAWRISPAPDEGSHSFMVTHTANSLDPVGWEDMRWGGDRGHSYYLYSPVPYVVYVPFERLQEAIGPVTGAARPDLFITRLGGVLFFGAAQLALTLWIVRRMCRRSSNEVVILLALAANLLPQLRYLHAYINTDSFTILAATACFAVALRLWRRDLVGLTDALHVGGALTAVAHGRYNAFVEAAALVVVFGVCVLRKAEGWRLRARIVGLAVAVPLLLAAPVHLAIYHELRNDHILASTDHVEIARSTYYGVIPEIPALGDQVGAWVQDTGSAWKTSWASYTAYYELNGPTSWLLAGLCLVGLVGLVLRPPELLTRPGRGVAFLAVGALLVTWVLMVSWPYRLGRFLLPAGATALTAAIVGGGVVVQRITRKNGLLISASAWLTVMVVLNAMALWSTVPKG